jgi:hypothetical protein
MMEPAPLYIENGGAGAGFATAPQPNFALGYKASSGIPQPFGNPQDQANFWAQYAQFLPLLSNVPFGSNMTANLGGTSAMLQGGLTPNINRFYAMTTPEIFPSGSMQRLGNQITAPDNTPQVPAGTGALNVLSHYGQNIGLGLLAIALIIAGVIYLALQNDTVKAAAKDAAKVAMI